MRNIPAKVVTVNSPLRTSYAPITIPIGEVEATFVSSKIVASHTANQVT